MQHQSMRAGLAAMLAAAGCSLANAAIGVAGSNSGDSQSVTDYAAELALSVALIAAAAAFVFLLRYDAGRSRRAGGVGWIVAAVGAAFAGVGNLFENGFGVSVFGLLFALGGLVLFISLSAGSVLSCLVRRDSQRRQSRDARSHRDASAHSSAAFQSTRCQRRHSYSRAERRRYRCGSLPGSTRPDS